MRIISLVPSITETICDFGRSSDLVGCTNFCVQPPGLQRHVALVGGTKDPNVELIKSLNPDMVIVNEEENRKEDADALMKYTSVHNTFPKAPSDVPPMIRKLGEVLNERDRAETWARAIENELRNLAELTPIDKSFAYFIWKEPMMVVSDDTYISQTLALAGLSNAYVNCSSRYPETDWNELNNKRPDLIFLSSEPYPFRQRDLSRFKHNLEGQHSYYKIDGQLFSWYGTRTLKCLQLMSSWTSEQLAGCQPWSNQDD